MEFKDFSKVYEQSSLLASLMEKDVSPTIRRIFIKDDVLVIEAEMISKIACNKDLLTQTLCWLMETQAHVLHRALKSFPTVDIKECLLELHLGKNVHGLRTKAEVCKNVFAGIKRDMILSKLFVVWRKNSIYEYNGEKA